MPECAQKSQNRFLKTAFRVAAKLTFPKPVSSLGNLEKPMRNIKIIETVQTRQTVNTLSAESLLAYQRFQEDLRQGKHIAEEKLLENFPSYFIYRLPTWEFVVYQRQTHKTWFGTTLEITIKCLVNKDKFETWLVNNLVSTSDSQTFSGGKYRWQNLLNNEKLVKWTGEAQHYSFLLSIAAFLVAIALTFGTKFLPSAADSPPPHTLSPEGFSGNVQKNPN